MAALYLCCSAGFSPDAGSGGYSLVVAPGLFFVVASPAAEHRLKGKQLQQLWPKGFVAPRPVGSSRIRD